MEAVEITLLGSMDKYSPLETQILSEPKELLLTADKEKLIKDLVELAKKHEDHHEIGTPEKNMKSLQSWMIWMRCYYLLTQMHHPGAKEMLEVTCNKKVADWEASAIDYLKLDEDKRWFMIEGLWQMVATFAPGQRQGLAKAYRFGDKRAKNMKRAALWEKYDFAF